MNLPLQSYRPRQPDPTRNRDDGSISAVVYIDGGYVGRVEVFTYPGGTHGAAFTAIEGYCSRDGRLYHCRMSRAYSERWLSRLAREFAKAVDAVVGGGK